MKNLVLLFGLVLTSGFFASESSAREVCQARMVTARGNLIQQFSGSGWDRHQACQNARMQCERDLRWRQNRGRNPRARCEVLKRGGHRRAQCTATMHRRNGRVIDSFTRMGRHQRHACRKASRVCQDDLRRRQSQGRNPHAYCHVQNQAPQRVSCSVSMYTRRGRVIDTFQAFGRNHRWACQNAQNTCKNDLDRRQRQGRNPHAYCGQSNQGGRQIHRQCRAGLRHPNGQILQVYVGNARGPMGTGVRNKACRKALRQCRADARRGLGHCIELRR